MKKAITSFIIFFIMVGAITYFHITLNKTCDEIVEQCNTLEDIIFQEQWDVSYENSVNLLSKVEESYTPFAVFLNHTELDNMKNETAKLTEYIETEEKSEAMASIHYVKFTAKNIKDVNKVTLQNIF